jgi:hypothetical protein
MLDKPFLVSSNLPQRCIDDVLLLPVPACMGALAPLEQQTY